MMQHEFEALAGYEVGSKDYDEIIEPMYMALPTVSKQQFVQMISRERFALPTQDEMISQMKDLAREIFELTDHTGAFAEERQLHDLIREYINRFHGGADYYTSDMYTDGLWSCWDDTKYRGGSFPVQLRIYYIFHGKHVEDDRAVDAEMIDLLPDMIDELGYKYGIYRAE